MYNVVYIFGHIENASTFRFMAGAVTIIVILIGSSYRNKISSPVSTTFTPIQLLLEKNRNI